MPHAGRGTLVHVGEKECHEWCREQRANRARSQALSGASSGTSMQRQGSVLVMPARKILHNCMSIYPSLPCMLQFWIR